MKFSIKDFFSKCGQIWSFLQIWSHLLKKTLMDNFILCAVVLEKFKQCNFPSFHTANESIADAVIKQEYIENDTFTTQKMKFTIKDFFSKCDQIRSFLRIWSHLLKKPLMENFIFYAVIGKASYQRLHDRYKS